MLIDGHSRRKQSANLIRAWLLNLPVTLGMNRISPVIVEEPRPGTLCGFTLVAESHCSVHWYGDAVHLDVFSCQSFSYDKVVEMAIREFRLSAYDSQVIENRLDLSSPR